jgi:hypothetical protein
MRSPKIPHGADAGVAAAAVRPAAQRALEAQSTYSSSFTPSIAAKLPVA